MKKIFFILIAFFTASSFSIAQQIPYHPLDDDDYSVRFSFLDTIIRDSLIEEIPQIESRFDQQESLLLQLHFLKALTYLKAESAVGFIYDFINNTFEDPFNEAGDFDLLGFRADATDMLFSFNDFSTYLYVYEYVDNHSGVELVTYLPLLKKVGINISAEKMTVYNKLLNFINIYDDIKKYCFEHLVDVDANLALNEIIWHLTNDPDESTRSWCMTILEGKYGFKNFKQLFQDLLYSEPAPRNRKEIAFWLAEEFNDPAEIKFLKDYIIVEPDLNAKIFMITIIDNFKPEKPDLSFIEYRGLFEGLGSILTECRSYNWIDESVYSYHLTRQESLAPLFDPGPQLPEACDELNIYIEDVYKERGNLGPVWPYLHWYLVYIKEKMNFEQFICE